MKLPKIKKVIKIFIIIMIVIYILPIKSSIASTVKTENTVVTSIKKISASSGGIVVDKGGLSGIYGPQDATYNELAGKIIGIVQLLCYAAAVIVLLYKGVQFMMKSPEAKAELKKELVSYAIGAFILFSIGTIIRIIGSIALKLF